MSFLQERGVYTLNYGVGFSPLRLPTPEKPRAINHTRESLTSLWSLQGKYPTRRDSLIRYQRISTTYLNRSEWRDHKGHTYLT